MDLNSIRSLRARKSRFDMSLARIEEKNDMCKKLEKDINDMKNRLNSLEQYRDYLNLLLKASLKESSEFRERRVAYLQENITMKINQVFEKESFTAKVNFFNKYGKDRVSLVLYNHLNKPRIPYLNEGKFMQELIGFASSMSLIELLGTDKFYIDEAFAASSESNKHKIPSLLKEYLDRGMQMILVSQSEEIFTGLPRRVVTLHKSGVHKAEVVSEVDYEC